MTRIVPQREPYKPSRPVKNKAFVTKWGKSRTFCYLCGKTNVALQNCHIIGGRGGRSDEACNLYRGCFECHAAEHRHEISLRTILEAKKRFDPSEYDEARLTELNGKGLNMGNDSYLDRIPQHIKDLAGPDAVPPPEVALIDFDKQPTEKDRERAMKLEPLAKAIQDDARIVRLEAIAWAQGILGREYAKNISSEHSHTVTALYRIACSVLSKEEDRILGKDAE